MFRCKIACMQNRWFKVIPRSTVSSQIMFCKLNMKKTVKAAILDFSFIGLIYMACFKVIFVFVFFFVCFAFFFLFRKSQSTCCSFLIVLTCDSERLYFDTLFIFCSVQSQIRIYWKAFRMSLCVHFESFEFHSNS